MKSQVIKFVIAVVVMLPFSAIAGNTGHEQPIKWRMSHFNIIDTIPASPPSPATPVIEHQPVVIADPVVKPVIKIVPKARKQIKPTAIPKVIPVKPIKIVKPRIVVKTGLL